MQGLLLYVSPLLLLLRNSQVEADAFLQRSFLDSEPYRTFLSTNVARFIALTTHRVTCPQDPGLLFGEHLKLCLNDELAEEQLWKISNQSLQAYGEASMSYSGWLRALVNETILTSSGSCAKSPSAEEVAELLSRIEPSWFWVFNPDMIKLNQQLGVFGVTGKEVQHDDPKLKEYYFESLAVLQNTSTLPYEFEDVVLSFDDGNFVRTLQEKNYARNSLEFMFGGGHLYEEPHKTTMRTKAREALQSIRAVNEKIYQSIVQSIAAIGFYKGEDQSNYSGGTTIALLGAVWMDPPSDWTVAQIADIIVHEFIHTALNQAELVHGLVANDYLRKTVKTTSAIRKQRRPYDKSFHAAYVSVGLLLFHARAHSELRRLDKDKAAEHVRLMQNLIVSLGESVQELQQQHEEHQVLSGSGVAMLNQLVALVKSACLL